MATWTNEGWLWSGDASVFECQGMGRYRLFYSTLLRSYRLRDRDTRLWAPWWFTKEYVKQQRRPNELVVVEAVIRMTKDREREFDANAAVDRMYGAFALPSQQPGVACHAEARGGSRSREGRGDAHQQ